MATLEIELNDDGSVGTLPPELQKFMDAKINQAFGKGAEKAAKEAQAQVEDAVKRAREEERRSGGDPAAVEKVKNLETELSKLREEEALRTKNYEEAQRLRDERYAKDMAERDKRTAEVEAASKSEIERREARLRQNIRTDIKAEAVKAGTRDASIDEVSKLLKDFVGLNDDFDPVVNAEAFRAEFSESKLGEDGQPVSIEGLVAEYLALKPHHKNPVTGKGGGARGGYSTSGTAVTTKNGELANALQAVQDNPTIDNVADAFRRMSKTA